MKRIIVTGLAIVGICSPILGAIFLVLDTPKDSITAHREVWNRDELKPLRSEYEDMISTRIRPLKYSDITNLFGAKLDKQPDGYALPMYVKTGQGMSGLFGDYSKGHTDYYAVGLIGYLQVYYSLYDGQSVGIAAFYLRTDDKFVPLQSTDDFVRRLEWDKAGFASLKQWLNEHQLPKYQLPKLTVTNLGVVEVSSNAPSRIVLGDGKTCIVTTRYLIWPRKTNDWFTMELMLDTKNDVEREESRNYRSATLGQSVSFTMDGKLFRFTPKLKK